MISQIEDYIFFLGDPYLGNGLQGKKRIPPGGKMQQLQGSFGTATLYQAVIGNIVCPSATDNRKIK